MTDVCEDMQQPIVEISNEHKQQLIFDNINELCIQDRISMIQIIYNSSDRSMLKEKGNGIQIKLTTISHNVLNSLYILLIRKLKEQHLFI